MSTVTAICIILCTLIICTFIFFTIVYLSELKREKTLRKLMLEESDKMQSLLKLPIVLMDIPIKQSQEQISTPSVNKDKKSVN